MWKRLLPFRRRNDGECRLLSKMTHNHNVKTKRRETPQTSMMMTRNRSKPLRWPLQSRNRNRKARVQAGCSENPPRFGVQTPDWQLDYEDATLPNSHQTETRLPPCLRRPLQRPSSQKSSPQSQQTQAPIPAACLFLSQQPRTIRQPLVDQTKIAPRLLQVSPGWSTRPRVLRHQILRLPLWQCHWHRLTQMLPAVEMMSRLYSHLRTAEVLGCRYLLGGTEKNHCEDWRPSMMDGISRDGGSSRDTVCCMQRTQMRLLEATWTGFHRTTTKSRFHHLPI